MRKIKKHSISIVGLLAVLLLSSPLYSQNYKEDMEKIRSAYSKYHSYSINYLYYPYDSVKNVTDSIKGTCVVDNNSWYYKIRTTTGLVEYLKNEKYYMEINHFNKVIFVNKSSAAKNNIWNMNKVDSLLRLPSSKMSYKDKGSKGEYDITLESSSWNTLKMMFNKDHYTLDEIWLCSGAKGKILGEPYSHPVIKILFTRYSEAIPAKSDFSQANYIQETSEGKLEGVDAFKEFKVLDYVNKKT